MKIGILTIHNSPNYGACLQCFALWKYLTDCGFDTEVIDLYRPLAFEDYIPSQKYKRMRPENISKYNKLKQIIRKILGEQKKPFVSLYNDDAKVHFDVFNSQMHYSNPYKSVDSLYSNPPIYDAVIAGSDQLWNPTQVYCLEPFFLTFADKKHCKKLSYATSIGISDLYASEKQLFKKWLEDFNAISVREKQAQSLLTSFLDKEIAQVADPTFLLDIDLWQSLTHRTERKGYIMLFNLNPIPEMVQYVLKLSEQSGKRLVVVGQKEHHSDDDRYEVIDDAGPQEWMGLIAGADMVITNSFHCTVFSILLGAKNFYTYIAPTNKRGSRITDLLSIFDLSNHLLDPSLEQSYAELEINKINRVQVLNIHKTEQARSRDFLLRNLN